MRVVLQRVTSASVVADGVLTGQIEHGLMILVGVGHQSTAPDARWLAAKVQALRVFSDANGKMNLSVVDVAGAVLAISQFTLYGSAAKGRRPSFVDAAPPARGEQLYEVFCDSLTIPVASGVFGADMQITMTADGPVTLTIESEGR